MSFHLVVVKGRNQGKRIPLMRFPFVIGRQPTCQLRAASMEISRQHCLIDAEGGALRIKDLGSTNGTFVNQRKIHGEQYLNDYDLLQVGPLSLLFRLEAADQAVEETPPTSAPATNTDLGDAENDSAATLMMPLDELPAPTLPEPPPVAEPRPVNAAQRILQQYKQGKR